MNVNNVRVEAVSSKPVNTKFGPKPTYSFKADGQWYKTGFKNHGLVVGDTVSFDYTPGTYGNEVDTGSIKKGAATADEAPATARPAPATGGSKGTFPIGPLDGQRSIVRQNALTNAREIYVAAHGGKPFAIDIETSSAAVIALAKKFEAYTTGDMDMELAKASLEAEGVAKH